MLMTTKKELANAYQISRETLRKNLNALGIKTTQKLITPKELELIYAELGKPEEYRKN
jgi:response regulator of citrate/malate metabolism